MQHVDLKEAFDHVTTVHADRVAFRFKKDGSWHDLTWGQHREAVRRINRALIGIGIRRGRHASILSQTRLEWVQLDSALVTIGAVSVGIYHSVLPVDVAYIARHSDSEAIFVENDEQLAKVLEMRDELTGLRHIIRIDGDGDASRGVMSWDEFLSHANDVPDEAIEQEAAAIKPEDLACLIYTSGTTGVPKGAMITHDNLVFTSWAAEQVLECKPHYVTLLFLPLAHVFARMIVYMCQKATLAIAFAEDFASIPKNLLEVKPHFIISVPRVYEKVCERAQAAAGTGLRRRLFDWAIAAGWSAAECRIENRPVPLLVRLREAIADRLVLRKIRDRLGGRIVWTASGAAPLSVAVAEFFHSCGIWMVEGIGMTENTSLTNANKKGATRLGSVGKVVPGVEMKTAEDGEVLYRGRNVMKGYYKAPEATAEAIDEDGWLYTGDIGVIDDEGFLKITDRKKDLIVTAGGKNVAPQRIEKLLCSSPLISQAVAYGDRRKYISALIATTPDAGDGRDEAALIEAVGAEVERINGSLASYESVKKFRLLPRELSIEAGELTPTIKIKRKVVFERYAELLESMYDDA